jgi:hypothetical protein
MCVAMLFSTLDMRSAYHQVDIKPSDREKTAFTVGSLGYFHWNNLVCSVSHT